MPRLLLIDTFNYIHRAYHALPKTFTDKNGEPVNAVYGFTSMLLNTLDILKPTHVIAAMDEESGPTVRSTHFAQYKATRAKTDDELIAQIPKIEEVIEAFGIAKILSVGHEADDIIGCAAKKAEELGWEVIIVSNDKDVLQLLSSNVKVFKPDNKLVDGGEFFGEDEFKGKYGFDPIQMIDYKALRGDTSDNIPGVYGIGDKTAQTLVLEYKTLENLYDHIENVKPESVKNKLITNKEMAFLSKKIATIACDLDINLDLENCKIKQVDRLNVLELLKKYNFKSLIRRLGFDIDDKVKITKVSDDQLPLV